MTDTPNATIGEATGLVPEFEMRAVKFQAETDVNAAQAERDAALKRITRLEADLAAEKSIRADRETAIAEMSNKMLEHEATRQLAVTEACKAKSEAIGHKRRIATLDEANAALAREVDQLRGKGAELWKSLQTAKEAREVAVRERVVTEEALDAALCEVESLKSCISGDRPETPHSMGCEASPSLPDPSCAPLTVPESVLTDAPKVNPRDLMAAAGVIVAGANVPSEIVDALMGDGEVKDLGSF